eukprot:1182902-Prorocentrum_minimum.AAC.3
MHFAGGQSCLYAAFGGQGLCRWRCSRSAGGDRPMRRGNTASTVAHHGRRAETLVGMSQRNGVTNTELTSLPAGGCGFGVPHATMDRLE